MDNNPIPDKEIWAEQRRAIALLKDARAAPDDQRADALHNAMEHFSKLHMDTRYNKGNFYSFWLEAWTEWTREDQRIANHLQYLYEISTYFCFENSYLCYIQENCMDFFFTHHCEGKCNKCSLKADADKRAGMDIHWYLVNGYAAHF